MLFVSVQEILKIYIILRRKEIILTYWHQISSGAIYSNLEIGILKYQNAFREQNKNEIGLKIMNDNKKLMQVYKNKLMKEMVKTE